ncbi:MULTISPECIES: NifB/NifX family molybdenum-iron cluster-binding protein [Ruminococcus]|uniref:Dinitrogenase iron-molybdenum cofactor biosynthesis protein n=1 Tax=Ruminococcus albus (strain ATCC 27210 / DSM 20455 / JCM 14654 / NCDO 2250 / 7) TaxID=697329 RepID=E6UE49_RUMA7|nr:MULTISPECIES: NifB/NifX family molybdenum-iron cluster-binding protein [Ruminococcus]ADU22914.1 Dinitrogenase iron-molybdenum cofactor biosynthesis protein [Ruminococcus albus 7 = DSM 20455]MCR5019884.1 dinitrogenase iron-molybdenum cofactor biosynthesis protein [Ruminococcus sp.]
MSRLAIATSDGFTVNEHFGHAKFFRVYDLGEDGYTFSDVRDAVAVTQQTLGHDTTRFDKIIELLADCDAVLVQKIGEGAAAYLIGRGVRVFEVSGPIDAVLNRFIEDKLV